MLTDEKGNIPAKMQKPVLGYDGKGLVYSDDFTPLEKAMVSAS